MEANHGGALAAELPEGLPSVIPGWFSEISPMWPGNSSSFFIQAMLDHYMFVEMLVLEFYHYMVSYQFVCVFLSVLFFPISVWVDVNAVVCMYFAYV